MPRGSPRFWVSESESGESGGFVAAGGPAYSEYRDGAAPSSTAIRSPGRIPSRIRLDQNAPNPFREQTTIRYRLDGPAHVRLTLFDELGRHLATLVDSMHAAGSHTVHFDGTELAPGIYFCHMEASGNEAFVRELLSGSRRKTRDEIFAISRRLDVSPTFIKLSSPLSDEPDVQAAVEKLIRRYGLSYVESRAVLLFDIVEFSLYTPFEQASQLNSLSYSLNSAYNKLLARGIEINFARTTTGDGYYIWNRKLGAEASRRQFISLFKSSSEQH